MVPGERTKQERGIPHSFLINQILIPCDDQKLWKLKNSVNFIPWSTPMAIWPTCAHPIQHQPVVESYSDIYQPSKFDLTSVRVGAAPTPWSQLLYCLAYLWTNGPRCHHLHLLWCCSGTCTEPLVFVDLCFRRIWCFQILCSNARTLCWYILSMQSRPEIERERKRNAGNTNIVSQCLCMFTTHLHVT